MSGVAMAPTLLAVLLVRPFSNEEFKFERWANLVLGHIVSEARRPLPHIQSKTLTAVSASADAAERKSTIRDLLCLSLGTVKHL
jgi:hypothetical protein